MDEAKEKLQLIVDLYPDSSEAATSEKILKTIEDASHGAHLNDH
jgi:hypothetical protein